MKCDLCPDDDGKGIHYHAFIDGKDHWVCEACKKKLKIETEHMDDWPSTCGRNLDAIAPVGFCAVKGIVRGTDQPFGINLSIIRRHHPKRAGHTQGALRIGRDL